MMEQIERRFTPVPVEARNTDGLSKIVGYAATFNRESRNLGGFREVVDPAAFNQSRGDGWPEVVARYNHDDNLLLGTTAAGTLQLRTDKYGLEYEVEPPKARADILELVQRGDVRKSSFAFMTLNDDWTVDEAGFPLRTLLSVRLIDVAPVNVPAYADTTAGLRSLAVKMEAPLEEVRALAELNELRKFFTRSDGEITKQAKKKTTPAQANIELLARKQDPWGVQ